MSSKGGRRHLKKRSQARPSAFFLVALGAGLLLFIWILVQVMSSRSVPEKNPLGAAAVSAAVRAA